MRGEKGGHGDGEGKDGGEGSTKSKSEQSGTCARQRETVTSALNGDGGADERLPPEKKERKDHVRSRVHSRKVLWHVSITQM